MRQSVTEIVEENEKRKQSINSPYNQLTGEGCTACLRDEVHISDLIEGDTIYLPQRALKQSRLLKRLSEVGSLKELLKQQGVEPTDDNAMVLFFSYQKERFLFDFEYWACYCWNIEQKTSEKTIKDGTAGTFQPLVLNRGQRKILKQVYEDLENRRPLRYIICKARQWGCSTFFSALSGWFQNVLFVGCNSAVVAHTEDPASEIRSMFINAIEHYPALYIETSEGEVPTDQERLRLRPYNRSNKTLVLPERDYRISIGSSVKPDSLRSKNINIAHLSEVAYFEHTKKKTPQALCQSITSGISMSPNTLIVYESTPNGTGNFFHKEYIRAKNKQSAFKNIFVAWYEIDNYSSAIDDYDKFITQMNPKEWLLWESGATLEAIQWYRQKRLEYIDEWRFISEFPSNDQEAFQNSGQLVFSRQDIERQRQHIREPEYRGEIVGAELEGKEALQDIRFIDDPFGRFKIWSKPSDNKNFANRYLVVVDIGVGLSESADNSIICVFDRCFMTDGGVPEVVAEWAGHDPKDIIVWRAVQIAKYYHNALLVVEKNSIIPKATDYSHYILDAIQPIYSNIYAEQTNTDSVTGKGVLKYGFHTNHSSKLKFVTFFQEVLRRELYIERNDEALQELLTYQRTERGTFEAIEGNRDDRVITRCIGMIVCYHKMPAVVELQQKPLASIRNNKAIGLAQF